MQDAHIADLLQRGAKEHSARAALVAKGCPPLTFGDLHALACRTAVDLAAADSLDASRVALILEHGPVLAASSLSIASTTTCVPLNPDYTAAELSGLLRRLRVSLVATAPGPSAARTAAHEVGIPVVDVIPDESPDAGAGVFSLQLVRSHSSQVPTGAGTSSAKTPPATRTRDDVGLVLHTSGSTAAPKIVPLTHANLMASADNVARSLDLTSDDVCLSVLPLFHIGALVDLLLAPLSRGATVAIGSGMTGRDFLADLDTFDPTWYQAVPPMLLDILRQFPSEPAGPARTTRAMSHRLRFIRSVSAPLTPATHETIERVLGVPVIEIYGMTETAGVITSNPLPPGERRVGSVGRATGPEVTIVDGSGNAAAPGERGEVLVRGASVMAGYEGLSPDIASFNGWLRTGDEGWFDADGYLYLTGRIKEIINRGGEKIAPREIDEVVAAHPAVHAAAAFGMPHKTLGEEVAVAVVPAEHEHPQADDVIAFCADRLAPFKVPRRVFVVEELPRAPGGKLQRRRLRDWCAPSNGNGPGRTRGEERLGGKNGEPGTTADRTPMDERREALCAQWAEILEVPSIALEDDFFDLGGDSLRAVEFMQRLREQTGIQLPAVALYDHPTVETFARYLDTLPAQTATPRVRSADVDAMFAEIRGFLSTWQGQRPRPDSLLIGWNTMGSRPPLFWGVQGHADLADFAGAIGSDQPVFGMRSLYGAANKTQVTFEALADHYAAEIAHVQPEGPIHIGGLCAGGAVAARVAEGLRDRGREIASLHLFEHYSESTPARRTCCYFNVDSGWHPFADNREPWRAIEAPSLRLYPSHASHDGVLVDPALVSAVRAEIDAVEPAGGSASSSRQDEFSTPTLTVTARFPSVVSSRARQTLEVVLRNDGPGSCPAGTAVFDRWRRAGGRRRLFDARAVVPTTLPAGSSTRLMLDVVAPMTPGLWNVSFDVVPGGDWMATEAIRSAPRRTLVLPGRAVLGYLRRRLPGYQ